MVALAQIDRLQDVEIEGVFDLARSIALRQIDVHDHMIVAIRWAELAESFANDPLIGSDARKRKATERRAARDDLDFRDASVGGSGAEKDCSREQGTSGARAQERTPENARPFAEICRPFLHSHHVLPGDNLNVTAMLKALPRKDKSASLLRP